MEYLEQITVKYHNGYFVDLFVRPSNKVAVNMYRNFGITKKKDNIFEIIFYFCVGYEVYQTVNKYYSSSSGKSEDAYGIYLLLKIIFFFNLFIFF